ncbi:hypothetical protein D3C78_984520 [compost metagenome]
MPERQVAKRMPPLVVDRFEVVHIAHQHCRAAAVAALDSRQFCFDMLHEMAPVGQLGEEVDGREFLQFGLDALAVGHVGDEAVPQRAAVLQPPWPRGALAPAQALSGQLDAVFEIPRRQAGCGGVERSTVGLAVIRMDDRVDRGCAAGDLLRADLVDIPDARAGIGKERLAMRQAPVLEDQARHFIGQAGDQVDRLLQSFRHRVHGRDVGGGADHAQWLALAVAADHLAAAGDPFVAAVLAADAVFHIVAGGLAIKVRLHAGLHVGQVIRMDALVAVFDPVGDLVIGITEDRFPARGVVNLLRLEIAVPDPGTTARDGQRHSSFAGAQGVSLLLQAGCRAVALDGHGRQAGQVAQEFALLAIQFAGLVVEQTECAERASTRSEQWAAGIEAQARIVDDQWMVAEALVSAGVGNHDHPGVGDGLSAGR